MPETLNSLPTSPLTKRQLELSLWYAKHKLRLRREVSFALVILDVLLLGFALFGTIGLLRAYGSHRAMLAALGTSGIDYAAQRELGRPKPLALSNVQALVSGDRADLIAEIANPNPNFAAIAITYHFSVDGKPLDDQRTYLLPNEQRLLLALGSTGVGLGTPVGVAVTDVRWMRQGEVETFRQQRYSFRVLDPKVDLEPLPGGADATVASFRFRNASARGFWQVNLGVILYSGDAVVGVAATRVDQLPPLDERSVRVRWLQAVPGVTRVEVQPEVNVYDESVYLPFTPKVREGSSASQ